MKFYVVAIFLSATIAATLAQFNGPVPQRLNIPGAIPAGPQFRNERVLPSPGVVRIRRPLQGRPAPLNAIPAIHPQRSLDEAKPVTEEPEDNFPTFAPHFPSSPSSPPQQQLTNEPINQNFHEEQLSRFGPQDRPAPIQPVQPQREIQSQAQRFTIQDRPKQQQQQQYRPAPIRARPAFREQQQQQQQPQYAEEEEEVQPQRKTVRIASHERPRPTSDRMNNEQQREKKPVAQILRKYRDENEDGTITWGFENDDGSYKEEVIGIDCVTRGRYGYVDPDGLKREYTYETGILCDPNNKNGNEEDEEQKGYVDYQENKAVLPNGVQIDLANMGKNKSRRPSNGQAIYRN